MPSLTHRRTRPFAFAAIAGAVALAIAGAAFARGGARTGHRPPSVGSLRVLVDHYRSLTWTYERSARVRRAPSSYADHRTTDPAYLEWLVDRWTVRAYRARSVALADLRRRLGVRTPRPPAVRAPLARRIAYSRLLTIRLRRVYPGKVTRSFSSARAGSGSETLRLWQQRSARAVLLVSRHAVAHPALPRWLLGAFSCIHRFEGAWNSNTGNGYYGGLQMDIAFQSRYGREFLHRFGTADRWPAWAQLAAAARAYRSGRGFYPWPATARACGLM